MLLERAEVSPCTRAKDGSTPLSKAAWWGNEGVVRMLLEQNDVNPNIGDWHGRTPLSRATRRGHEGVVRVLLEQNCNGIYLLFSLLYLPDVGCFLFRFYNK